MHQFSSQREIYYYGSRKHDTDNESVGQDMEIFGAEYKQEYTW